MFRQRILQWMLPGVVLVGLAAAALAPADPENPKSVLKQRLTVAQEANDAIEAMRKAKEHPNSKQVRRWSRWLMEAEMGMSEKKADQIAAINTHLLRMKELEKLVEKLYAYRELGYLELLEAKRHVLEAESLSSQAKADQAAR